MRRLASFLLLGVALAAGAADIWRWKDADGVIHYSDTPVPGAERLILGGTAPQSGEPAPAAQAPAPVRAEAPPAPAVRYTRCAVTQPTNDQVFFAVDSVAARVVIEPPLQPGHRIQVLLNGEVNADWPATAVNYTFTGLYRGSYTLTVRVVDAGGRVVCTGAVSSFHIRQPSVLSPQSPQRQQAPQN
jgi:Domain of unknown function (DUF4124)